MSIGSKLRRKERRQFERSSTMERQMQPINDYSYNQPIQYLDMMASYINPPIQLGCTPVQTTTASTPCYPPKTAPKKEKNMCYDCDMDCESKTPVETKQRSYLLSRLEDAQQMKRHAAKKTFFLDDDDAPAGASETLTRIAAGKYIIDNAEIEKYKKAYPWSSPKPLCGLTWRDPAKPADQNGFDAFVEVLEKSVQDVTDTINIGTPADGLKALQTFESAQ